MPSEQSSHVKFEIRHVLFIDIVGYSKLLINQQSDQLETLKSIVRGTEQFKKAEAEGKLLRLPTGDGGALVFRTTPESPVLCAMEIGKELKKHPELHVRMGIHSGPVNEVTDLNDQANIAGAGIIDKDAMQGPGSLEVLARVAARMGEPDRAIAALQKLLSIPYGAYPSNPLTRALLRLDPMFDPLRNDPRFQKLCEEKQSENR